MRQMMVLPDHIHFIGGCGRAMSGVMVAVADLGASVTGSDVLFFCVHPRSENLARRMAHHTGTHENTPYQQYARKLGG